MTITVVSTFHAPVLSLYGQRFVNSFSENIDSDIKLRLYAEDCNPVTKDPRIQILDAKQKLPKLKAKDLMGLNVEVKTSIKDKSKSSKGIF